MTDKKQVIFLQGAGDGAYEEDEKLAASLRKALGEGYAVHYPRMPDDSATDVEWTRRIGSAIKASEGDVIVVAHSVGGTALLKYFAENEVPRPIAGIFLVAVPYWAKGGWDYEGFTIAEDFPDKVPKGVPVFFYHNRDDETVPFAHLALYTARFPQAVVREGASGGHQFNNDLTQVAEDVKSLS